MHHDDMKFDTWFCEICLHFLHDFILIKSTPPKNTTAKTKNAEYVIFMITTQSVGIVIACYVLSDSLACIFKSIQESFARLNIWPLKPSDIRRIRYIIIK